MYYEIGEVVELFELVNILHTPSITHKLNEENDYCQFLFRFSERKR